MTNKYFDFTALRNWFDMQVQTYQGKPVCLKVEFYQKVGNKLVNRETKNFDGEEVTSFKDDFAINKYTAEKAWDWLNSTLDTLIPAGITELTVFYQTSKSGVKSHYPISLTAKKSDLKLSNLSNLHSNASNTDLIGTLQQVLQAGHTSKTEDEIRAEIRHELEQEKRIEDLENMVENIREEKLGSLKKIGHILESSPELSKTVAAMLQGIAGLVGSQIGKMVNNMTTTPQMQQAQVGTMDINGNKIVTDAMVFNAVRQQFPSEDPRISILKLVKVLEENESFKPMLTQMMQKVEL